MCGCISAPAIFGITINTIIIYILIASTNARPAFSHLLGKWDAPYENYDSSYEFKGNDHYIIIEIFQLKIAMNLVTIISC